MLPGAISRGSFSSIVKPRGGGGKGLLSMSSWFRVENTSALLSPSLIIDRGLLERNLQAMITLARGAGRLRPHVKTHKMPAIVRLLEARGVTRHKCATVAEAEMVATAGGADVLLAYPVVGPNIPRLAN